MDALNEDPEPQPERTPAKWKRREIEIKKEDEKTKSHTARRFTSSQMGLFKIATCIFQRFWTVNSP